MRTLEQYRRNVASLIFLVVATACHFLPSSNTSLTAAFMLSNDVRPLFDFLLYVRMADERPAKRVCMCSPYSAIIVYNVIYNYILATANII